MNETFIQTYMGLLTSNPLTTITTSLTILAIIGSLMYNLTNMVHKNVVSYWTRGTVTVKDKLSEFLKKARSTVEHRDYSSFKLKQHASGKWGFRSYTSDRWMHRDSQWADSSRESTILEQCLYDTKEEATAHKGYVSVPDDIYAVYYLQVVCVTCVTFFVSLGIDWLLTHAFTELLVVSLAGTLLTVILKGGRKAYDFTQKLNALDDKKVDKEQ